MLVILLSALLVVSCSAGSSSSTGSSATGKEPEFICNNACLCSVPGAVSGVAATVLSSNTVLVTWKAPTNDGGSICPHYFRNTKLICARFSNFVLQSLLGIGFNLLFTCSSYQCTTDQLDHACSLHSYIQCLLSLSFC